MDYVIQSNITLTCIHSVFLLFCNYYTLHVFIFLDIFLFIVVIVSLHSCRTIVNDVLLFLPSLNKSALRGRL